jgi:ATP-binding cassette subfamily B protein
MRESWRNLRRLFAFAYGIDPFRSITQCVLSAIEYGTKSLFALWLKILANGLIAHDGHAVMLGAVATALTYATSEAANLLGLPMGETLRDKTQHAVDLRLMKLTGNLTTIEHYERTDYLRELELLRGNRDDLSSAVGVLADNIGNVVRLVLSAVLLAQVSPILLALPLFAIPAVLIASRVASMNERVREETSEDERATSIIQWFMGEPTGAKEVRVFGLGSEFVSRYVSLRRKIARARNKMSVRSALLSAAGWTFFSVGYVGAVTLVVIGAVRGTSSVGDVLLALTLAQQMGTQVSGVAQSVGWLQTIIRVARRYGWLVDYAGSAPTEFGASLPDTIREGVRFEGVGFTYPGTDRQVLSGVDLFMPAGSTVAFVGDNGAGKTTLVKLLLRYYDPDAGRITVDGTDLREIDPRVWRSRMSGGFQDFMDFEFIARETVGIGDLPRIEDASVVGAAIDRSGASDVLEGLPNGLDTQLGTHFGEGEQLSIGQWQKLAIARAMMRDEPLLLVLDEPTAALDAMTEHALFERYVEASRARSSSAITLLVSHRFSTVRMADLIVVVNDGRIVEHGSHDELMSRNGLYAELYEIQASAYR